MIAFLKEYLRINAIKRLFSFVEVKRPETMGLVLFNVAFALIEGLSTTLLYPILQYVEQGKAVLEPGVGGLWTYLAPIVKAVNLDPLVTLLFLAFIPVVLRNVIFYFRAWYSSVVSSSIIVRLRMKVLNIIYEADPEFISRHPTGQLVDVTMSQTSAAGNAVIAVINLFGVIMLIVVYLIVLLVLSPPLTLSALFFAIVVALVNRTILKWIRENSLESAKHGQLLTAKIVERMGQMQLIKLRDTKKEESGYIRTVSEKMRAISIRLAKMGAVVEVIVDPLMMASVFVTLYIGISVFHSSLAEMGILLFVLTRLNAKVRELNGGLQSISGLTAGVKLVQEMCAAAKDANKIRSGGTDFHGLSKSIEFKNVEYTFADVYAADGTLVSQGKTVLKDINAVIPKGSFTALVGRSGAGKSTMLDLFPRLRDVTGGEILLDGVPITSFNVGNLRRGFGYVTQTPMLFNDTVYNNLTYGFTEKPSDEKVHTALAQAHALFVYDLPEGLETNLGDRGVRFSGGERQRIAMARVLLEDTDVLVFDEPTSALDSESEGYIQKTLTELHGKKTLVVIAHRLSTVVSADQLLVLSDGGIVERGTHAELLAKGGTYKKLFESQLL